MYDILPLMPKELLDLIAGCTKSPLRPLSVYIKHQSLRPPLPILIKDTNTIKQLKDENAWDKNDRNGITVFKTENLVMVITCLHKNALIKENAVDGLFQVHVLDGKIRINTDEGDTELKEGEVMVFHPNVRHTIEALKKNRKTFSIIFSSLAVLIVFNFEYIDKRMS